MSKPRKATRAEEKAEKLRTAAWAAVSKVYSAATLLAAGCLSPKAALHQLRHLRGEIDAAESALTEWQALRAKGAQEGDR